MNNRIVNKINEDLYVFHNVLPISLFYQSSDEFKSEYNNWFLKIEKHAESDCQPSRIGIARSQKRGPGLGWSLPLIDAGAYVKLIAEHTLKNRLKLIRVNTNIQFFGQESTYHNDGESTDYTFLIFLNDWWDAEWGGDFVIQKSTQNYIGFTPLPNMGILFRADLQHKGNAPNRLCPLHRMSVAYTFTQNLSN